MNSPSHSGSRRANRHILLQAAVVCVLMFGFGFAMVPLYRAFCDLTGINGRMAVVATETMAESDLSRLVTVQFVANRNQDLPWEFRPEVASIQVHPGEVHSVNYFARNLRDTPMIGRAVPSIAPGEAAKYLRKLECFCFTEQRFAGGEARDMPVRFYVDPRLPPGVETLTLSYTFFDAAP
ncbi:MAG TPA: cytochrome c oxidase assembly protein [Candidatus Macondimonas sp.]|nr:cytochrome c oxidase assembly protein [Candidatus Macondimonas sp.]